MCPSGRTFARCPMLGFGLPEDLHGVGAGRVPPRHSLPERIPPPPIGDGEIRPPVSGAAAPPETGDVSALFLEGGQTQSQKGEWGMGALGLVR